MYCPNRSTKTLPSEMTVYASKFKTQSFFNASATDQSGDKAVAYHQEKSLRRRRLNQSTMLRGSRWKFEMIA